MRNQLIIECSSKYNIFYVAQHVTLHILHLDNDVLFQRYVSHDSNNTDNESCLRKVLVSLLRCPTFDAANYYRTFCFQIHDGDSRTSPIKWDLCINKHPPAMVSNGNALTISLSNTTDNAFSFSFDIKAHYSVLDNGKFSCSEFASSQSTYINVYNCSMWRRIQSRAWPNRIAVVS